MLQGYLDGWLIVAVDENVVKVPNFSALDTYLQNKLDQIKMAYEENEI